MATPPTADLTPPIFFLDSSVILAGVASTSGASHILLVLGELGLVQLVTIPYVVSEVEKNLNKKLAKALPRYDAVRTSAVWSMLNNPSYEQLADWINLVPAKDAPVLVAAILANCARLVTLDTRHFIDNPAVSAKSGLHIATPGSIVQEIRGSLFNTFKK